MRRWRAYDEGSGLGARQAEGLLAPDPPRATGVGPESRGFCPFLDGYF